MRIIQSLTLGLLLTGCTTARVGSRAPAAEGQIVEVNLAKLSGRLYEYPVNGSYEFLSNDGSVVRIGCLKNIFSQTMLTVGIVRPTEVPGPDTIQGSMKMDDFQFCQKTIKPVAEQKFRRVKLSNPFRPDYFKNKFDTVEFSE